MKATISLLSVFLFAFGANGQQSAMNLAYPETGKPMPAFVLRNIAYFNKKQATENDLKGKWLILDFWSKYCSSCVASFPRMNIIQKKLGDSVQVMLIGIQDPENQIMTMYAKYTEKEHLNMPCDFDSLIAIRFDITAVPHLVIIDPSGIVKAVTNHLTLEEMEVLLAGGHPNLPKTYYRGHDARFDRIPFNSREPYLVNDNGGSQTDFEFRSILSHWTPDHERFTPMRMDLHRIDTTFRRGMFQVIGAPLITLYSYAYFGTFGWSVLDTEYFGKYRLAPVLEISDSSLFKYKSATGEIQNMFCYSLIVPESLSATDKMESIMQKDLASYFSFDASVQERECTYWKLVSSTSANATLKTKGGKEDVNSVPRVSVRATNISVARLVYLLELGHGDDLLITDNTGMKDNIDINLDCILTNLDDIRTALHAFGMDLIESKRPMQVLVIRDRK